MLDPVPLAPSEELCLSFINALQVKDASLNLRTIGEFVWEIPRYLGSSEPLDNAIACVLASFDQLALDANHAQALNRRLYGRTLQSLRSALVEPGSWRSTGTLAATVMMHRIEVTSRAISTGSTRGETLFMLMMTSNATHVRPCLFLSPTPTFKSTPPD